MLSALKTVATLSLSASLIVLSGCESASKPTSSKEVAAKGLYTAAFSEGSDFAVVGSIHHGGSLWRTQDNERLFDWNHKSGEQTTLVAADFSPNGNWALTAEHHTMVLWDVSTGEALRNWTAPGEVLSVSLSQNGNYALIGTSDHAAVIFDVKRGGIQRSFHHQNRVRSVDLSDNGQLAITGSEDYTAKLWNVQTGSEMQTVTHDDDVQLVVLSPDGTKALSVSKYDRAVVWDTSNGQILAEVPLAAEKLKRGLRFTSAKFSEDGRYLLTGRPDQIVDLWQVRDMKHLESWELPKRDAWKPTSAAVVAVGFSKTPNTYFAAASNGYLHKLRRQ